MVSAIYRCLFQCSCSSGSSSTTLVEEEEPDEEFEIPEGQGKQLKDHCDICLDPMYPNQVGSTLCEHVYHIQCIAKNLQWRLTCPHCRADLRWKVLSGGKSSESAGKAECFASETKVDCLWKIEQFRLKHFLEIGEGDNTELHVAVIKEDVDSLQALLMLATPDALNPANDRNHTPFSLAMKKFLHEKDSTVLDVLFHAPVDVTVGSQDPVASAMKKGKFGT